MGKALIIAEKPSVALELSRALSKAPGMSRFEKHKDRSGDYFENETHIVAAALGHLVELDLPTSGGRRVKWDFEHLPIDISSVKGFWRNKVTRILLVVVFTNLGSAVGTFVAIPMMMKYI